MSSIHLDGEHLRYPAWNASISDRCKLYQLYKQLGVATLASVVGPFPLDKCTSYEVVINPKPYPLAFIAVPPVACSMSLCVHKQ